MRISFVSRMALSGVITLALVPVATSQTSGWRASIVSASSEEPQHIHLTPGGSAADWPGRPPAHRWIKLTVEVTSPGKDVKLRVAQIQLSNEHGSYPATAIGYQVSPKHSIVYHQLLMVHPPHTDPGMKEAGKEPVGGGWTPLLSVADGQLYLTGYGFSADSKKLLFVVDGNLGGENSLVMKKSPLKLVLLFAVPEAAANLQLRVGDATGLAVPVIP
jgi:hypothetical protein